MSDNQPKLFFLHIPKAGGTTFYDIIYRNFAYREVAKIDGTQIARSIAKLSAQPMAVKNKFACVAGHFLYGFHKEFSSDHTYITFLRNPVDRVVSLFYQIKNVPQHPLHDVAVQNGMDIHSFAVSDLTREIDNDQVRRISGSENKIITNADLARAIENLEHNFSFVGICEEYDRSLVLLNRRFPGWDIRYLAKNISSKEPVSSQQAYDKTLDQIRGRNSLDSELYSYARSRFTAGVRREGTSVDAEVAVLRAQNLKLRRREQRFALPLDIGRRLRDKLRSTGWSPF